MGMFLQQITEYGNVCCEKVLTLHTEYNSYIENCHMV